MALRKKGLGYLVFIAVLGIVFGSILGEILGLLLPPGLVKDFFLKSITLGFSPTEVNLNILRFQFGLWLKLNIVGVLGVLFAAYIYRWY